MQRDDYGRWYQGAGSPPPFSKNTEMTKPYLPPTGSLARSDSPARVECFSYHFHSIRAARQQSPTARGECIPPPHAERVCSDIPPPLAGGGWGRWQKEWAGEQKRVGGETKAGNRPEKSFKKPYHPLPQPQHRRQSQRLPKPAAISGGGRRHPTPQSLDFFRAVRPPAPVWEFHPPGC